jgi:hypothetical protein
MLKGWVTVTQQRKQTPSYYTTAASYLTLCIIIALFKISLLATVGSFDHLGHQLTIYHASCQQVLRNSDM